MKISEIHQWLGRVSESHDAVTPTPVRALAATLDRENVHDELPPLWHWLYFLPSDRQSDIGPDGHAKRGGFLPPVPLPRRMWAGGRLMFHRPLLLGARIQRTSRIADISSKRGKSGELVFVCVHHEILDDNGIIISEEQDIVYREMPAVGDQVGVRTAARIDEEFSRAISPDPKLLFRYSALTFNGHRIHYDRTYATQEEGYPGLVVHGPLIATLLLEQLNQMQPNKSIKRFEFKAVNPLFDVAPFSVCGRIDGDTAALWARGPQGELAMQATAKFSRSP